jgi:ion channel-forming bestrophin family protein
MITYNPKDWWKLIFAFHRSDTFRILLPGMMGIGIYTALIAYLENEVWHLSFKNSTAMHSLIGFVLSLLLVFRTNSAYDRWWEGRKIWGSFNNNSRNLALKLNAILDPADLHTRALFKHLIANYLIAAKEHLRHGVRLQDLQATQGYDESYYKTAKHIPNRIAKAMFEEIAKLYSNQTISGDMLIVLNAELQSFTDNMGACERIKRTPIPYSYSLFLKKIIFLYVFTLPIGFVIDFKYWAVPVVMLVFYTFASIELIAEEIEDPFGTDSNDLPIDTICQTVKNNLDEILGVNYLS